MSVQETLESALVCLARSGGPDGRDQEPIEEARRWLARNAVLLDWITRHPKLVEINCEAAALLARYRGGVRRAVNE
jgi:hypothetical protein